MVQEALAFAYADGGDEWLTEDRPIDPPGPALRISENRAPTPARSFRASNAKFKAATGWSPRYPSARAGWAAIATALSTR